MHNLCLPNELKWNIFSCNVLEALHSLIVHAAFRYISNILEGIAKGFCKSLGCFSFAQIFLKPGGANIHATSSHWLSGFAEIGRQFFLAHQKYKSDIENFSLYILLSDFLPLSLMSPEKRFREKETNDTEIIWIIWPEGKKVQQQRRGRLGDENA